MAYGRSRFKGKIEEFIFRFVMEMLNWQMDIWSVILDSCGDINWGRGSLNVWDSLGSPGARSGWRWGRAEGWAGNEAEPAGILQDRAFSSLQWPETTQKTDQEAWRPKSNTGPLTVMLNGFQQLIVSVLIPSFMLEENKNKPKSCFIYLLIFKRSKLTFHFFFFFLVFLGPHP